MKEGFVLYVDHARHPAPLSLCYHATGARRLSSAVDRYPPATLTEVDSAYCPQCLSYHDASSAARLGFCTKPSCAQCPLCQAVCTATLEGSLIFYGCGSEACDWTSKECQVVVQLQVDDSAALGRLEWARAMEDLGTALQSRRTSPEILSEPWKKLSQAWETRRTDRNGGRRRLVPLSSSARVTDDGPEEEAWSVEALEASLKERKKYPVDEKFETKLQLPLSRISLLSKSDETTTPTGLDDSLKEVSPVALQLQALNRPNPLLTRAELLPLPIPLRPRQSRRCRAELAEERPGILLKPKLNPVEGDSSLRSGHGQWYKKDSSAILVMPRVRLMDYDTTPERSAFLLKVTNPTLGPVRLRFGPSTYNGEVNWDDPNGSCVTFLKDLLVDELMQESLQIDLQTTILQDLATTETVELLSAEDSFIEFGGKAREVPEGVRGWKAPARTVTASQMRVVASSSSTAWFELVTAGLEVADGSRPGLPISIEVELGNGSWESSLIPQKNPENDFVAFDLVIAW